MCKTNCRLLPSPRPNQSATRHSKPSSPIAGHNARPLSDASLASSSHSAGQQVAATAAPESAQSAQPNTTNGGQHQLYKQRSIRATLAPKFSPSSASASEFAPSTHQASSSASSNCANLLASSEQLPTTHKAHAPSRPNEQLQRQQRNQNAQYQHHHKGAPNGAPKQRSAELQQQQQQQQRLSQSDSSRSQASTSSSSHQSQVDQVSFYDRRLFSFRVTQV